MAREFTKSKEKEQKPSDEKNWRRNMNTHGSSGAIYGLGLIGVAVYYIQHAATFWIGVIGVIKAIFWPAILMYKVFEMLHL